MASRIKISVSRAFKKFTEGVNDIASKVARKGVVTKVWKQAIKEAAEAVGNEMPQWTGEAAMEWKMGVEKLLEADVNIRISPTAERTASYIAMKQARARDNLVQFNFKRNGIGLITGIEVTLPANTHLKDNELGHIVPLGNPDNPNPRYYWTTTGGITAQRSVPWNLLDIFQSELVEVMNRRFSRILKDESFIFEPEKLLRSL